MAGLQYQLSLDADAIFPLGGFCWGVFCWKGFRLSGEGNVSCCCWGSHSAVKLIKESLCSSFVGFHLCVLGCGVALLGSLLGPCMRVLEAIGGKFWMIEASVSTRCRSSSGVMSASIVQLLLLRWWGHAKPDQ